MLLSDRKPDRFETPYGTRLSFKKEHQCKIEVHLKDNQKIRHKKRWSQVSNELLSKFINLLVLFNTCDQKRGNINQHTACKQLNSYKYILLQ